MRPALVWTEDQDAMLQELHKTMSFSLIAEAINEKFGTKYSRNAAIGRAHRLQLEKSKPVAVRVVNRSKLGVGPMVQKIRRGKFGKAPEIPVETFIPRASDIVSLRKPLLELQAMECRWPDEHRNDVGLHTFCGNPTLDGHSYCEAHREIARGDGTASERAAMRNARSISRAA